MSKFRTIAHCENRGFTLIEILVVIAIMAVLAAVIIPNLLDFTGRGKVESANTELSIVQTAIIAYIEHSGMAASNLNGDIGPGTDLGPESFMNGGQLQANYTVTNGIITHGSLVSGSRWDGVTWDSTAERWR